MLCGLVLSANFRELVKFGKTNFGQVFPWRINRARAQEQRNLPLQNQPGRIAIRPYPIKGNGIEND